MRHYQQVSGRQLSLDRVMAWHLRTALGDALWRSEEGIPLADHRTPPEWVEDLAGRFSALGIHPEAITGCGTPSGCNPALRCGPLCPLCPNFKLRHNGHGP